MVREQERVRTECAKSNQPRATRRVMSASTLDLSLIGYNAVIISSEDYLGYIWSPSEKIPRFSVDYMGLISSGTYQHSHNFTSSDSESIVIDCVLWICSRTTSPPCRPEDTPR